MASVHPTSHGQNALWVLDQVRRDGAVNNTAIVARVRSAIDVPVFRLALQGVINRHASLRTTFTLRGNELVQQVHPRREVCFEQVDATAWDDRTLNEGLEAACRHHHPSTHR
jgi:hypothetical protein